MWCSAPRRGEGPRVPALPQRSVLAGESQEFPAAQEEGEGCDKCWSWLLGSAPAWEAGREPSCIPSTVPPVGSLCQERLQASRALRGIPACSLRPHAAAPHRWMQPRALLPRSLPSSAGTPLPLAPLYQVSPVPCWWPPNSAVHPPGALLPACLSTAPVPKSPRCQHSPLEAGLCKLPGHFGDQVSATRPPHGIFLLPTGGTRAVPSSWAANRGIWGRVGTVPKCCPFPLAPARPALTVQLHARLGASALHLPPWGQRLLPGSRPPSMEGSCGAGSPRAAGTEGPGAGSTPRAARHSTALRPGRRAEAE